MQVTRHFGLKKFTLKSQLNLPVLLFIYKFQQFFESKMSLFYITHLFAHLFISGDFVPYVSLQV